MSDLGKKILVGQGKLDKISRELNSKDPIGRPPLPTPNSRKPGAVIGKAGK